MHLLQLRLTYAAMVTSTSTPASMLMMICLTTSVGALRLDNHHN